MCSLLPYGTDICHYSLCSLLCVYCLDLFLVYIVFNLYSIGYQSGLRYQPVLALFTYFLKYFFNKGSMYGTNL